MKSEEEARKAHIASLLRVGREAHQRGAYREVAKMQVALRIPVEEAHGTYHLHVDDIYIKHIHESEDPVQDRIDVELIHLLYQLAEEEMQNEDERG